MNVKERTKEMLRTISERYDVEWKERWGGYFCTFEGWDYQCSISECHNGLWPENVVYHYGRQTKKEGSGVGEPSLEKLIERFDKYLPRRTEIQLRLF